jgi:hypothetical protein
VTTTTTEFEYTAADDPFLDFCLWPYAPAAPPGSKLRSLNILLESFRMCGVDRAGGAVVDALRRNIGAFSTVWGIKWVDGEMRWELYFYDYRRLERERSVGRVLEALRAVLPCAVVVDDSRPYFMFSIDLTTAMLSGHAALEEIHMYVGNVGSAVSSGICYAVTTRATTLENFYFFFDAERQMNEVVGKVCCSAYVDLPAVDVDEILWPELQPCHTLVVANKRHNDGVYFSRIGIGQLRLFLARLGYPAALAAFVEENRTRLDHLQYDVGLDYRMEQGKIRIVKSGFYGVF